jgi:phosphoribosyl-AMP cyclohydrolase
MAQQQSYLANVTKNQACGASYLEIIFHDKIRLNILRTMYMKKKSIKDTITYLHACCFSPVQDTWLKAIQNDHFATWPYVTVENVRKYLPKSDATAKCHMNQIRQNIRPNTTAYSRAYSRGRHGTRRQVQLYLCHHHGN